MSRSIPERIKYDGNVNRIKELMDGGCSASEVQVCFAAEGIHLKVVQGDFPLVANLQEMCRKALPKKIATQFMQERLAGVSHHVTPPSTIFDLAIE